MKIALINGSPKAEGSASGILLEDLKRHFSGETEVLEMDMRKNSVPEDLIKELEDAGVWVFAAPLYVDGIPSHVLSCLVQLEKVPWQSRERLIYGIVNCGFYEGIQAELALAVLRNWCAKAGFSWGGGIGVGGGGGLAMMPEPKPGKGPKAPIHKALDALADQILKGGTKENVYVSVAFPRVLYKLAAQMGWRQMIKSNGGKAQDLGKRLE